MFAAGGPERLEVDVSHDGVSVLSCHLLCFPFALDLPSDTMSAIFQLYDSCGVVASLMQVRAFPCSDKDLADKHNSLMQQRITLAIGSHQAHTTVHLNDSCESMLLSCLICDELSGWFRFFVLWQVIQTLPPLLLELPLSLLSRLLLGDPGRSVSRLTKAACGFFAPPRNSQLPASKHQTPQTRTASSLLSDLLQLDALWDSAVELLTLLSQVARCCPQPARLQLHLEASVLHQALAHSHDQIRAATCRLLGNLDPFRPPTLHTLQSDIFKSMIACLHDPCMPVRRTACWAVGSWLGYIVAEAGFKIGWSNEKGSDTTRWGREKEPDKHMCSHREAAGELATILEQGVDDEEERKWMEEARRTGAMLASLITDPDALTRRHCCAALGNLVNVDGAVSLLLEEDVFSLLLRAACTDSHNAVRQAAIATLCLYSRQDAIRQVMKWAGTRGQMSTLQSFCFCFSGFGQRDLFVIVTCFNTTRTIFPLMPSRLSSYSAVLPWALFLYISLFSGYVTLRILSWVSQMFFLHQSFLCAWWHIKHIYIFSSYSFSFAFIWRSWYPSMPVRNFFRLHNMHLHSVTIISSLDGCKWVQFTGISRFNCQVEIILLPSLQYYFLVSQAVRCGLQAIIISHHMFKKISEVCKKINKLSLQHKLL